MITHYHCPPPARANFQPWTWVCGYAAGGAHPAAMPSGPVCPPPPTVFCGAQAVGGHTGDTIVTGATCLCPPTIVGCPPPVARPQAHFQPWTWVCGYAAGGANQEFTSVTCSRYECL